MKRLPAKLIGAALLLLLPLLLFVGAASAQTIKSGNTVTITKDQTVDSTAFLAGSTVEMAGTVNGDIFCAGQTVTISGTVNGDVLCAGQTVTISGTVNGNVRLGGQSITIDGTVARNASVAGQSVTIGNRASVTDLMGAANTVSVSGEVKRDFGLGSQNALISGTIGRNINGAVNQLELTSTAKVGGAITYTSANDAKIAEGAAVNGKVTRNEPSQQQRRRNYALLPFLSLLWALYIFVALLVVSLALVLLFPQTFERSANHAISHLGRTVLVGLATSLLVPAVITVLLFTVIGIPLALLAGLVWLVALFLSGPFAAYLLGRSIARGAGNAVVVMLIGAVVLLVIYFIPVVGFLALIAAQLFGIGMVTQLALDKFERPKYNTGR